MRDPVISGQKSAPLALFTVTTSLIYTATAVRKNTHWLCVRLRVFRENHLPEPVLDHGVLQALRTFRSFSEDFFFPPTCFTHLAPSFVPLSRVAYVPAPPSSLPGGRVGTSCAPFLTEKKKGWRRGTGGVAAVSSTSGGLMFNISVTTFEMPQYCTASLLIM